jgi:hypothetical protein
MAQVLPGRRLFDENGDNAALGMRSLGEPVPSDAP